MAQEWFTSFEVAKRLALVQNKMLFVIWEDTLKEPYYIAVNDDKGNLIITDLTKDEAVNSLIWEFFVPVALPESLYGEFLGKAKKIKSITYTDKLEDDSIKIMDVNGYILNARDFNESHQNLSKMINLYALNTTYLTPYYRSYLKEKNFTTAFNLASKQLDFALFSKNKKTRLEVVRLGNLYFEEARKYLDVNDIDKEIAFLQKTDLQNIKAQLVLNKPRKAKRLLKKFEASEIENINESLYVLLNYTTFMLLHDEEAASIWKDRLTEVDLKKANLILKTYIPNWKAF